MTVIGRCAARAALLACFVLAGILSSGAGAVEYCVWDPCGGAENPGEWSVGAVAAVFVSPYKSYDTRVLPLPFVYYEGERLYIRGTRLGGHLFKNDNHELSAGFSFLGQSFSPSKTDSKPLKFLDKRHMTMQGELAYSYISKIGLFRTRVEQDVLGNSNGFVANASWHVPWMTDKFIIMPGLGIEYASAQHNRYYYGISGDEAVRSGLQRYKPGASVTPYLSLEAKIKISDSWDIVAKGRVDRLPSKVKDSPMVGRSYAGSFMAGVQRTF